MHAQNHIMTANSKPRYIKVDSQYNNVSAYLETILTRTNPDINLISQYL